MAVRKKTKEFWSHALSYNFYPSVIISSKGKTRGFSIHPSIRQEQKGAKVTKFKTLKAASNYLNKYGPLYR